MRIDRSPGRAEDRRLLAQRPTVTTRNSSSRFDLMATLEPVYAVDAPPERWLAAIVDAVTPMLDQGEGGCAYFVDVSSIEAPVYWGFVGPAAVQGVWVDWFTRFPTEAQAHAHRTIAFGTLRGLGPGLPDAAMAAALQPTPFVDMLGINGVDAGGRGVSLAFPARHIIRPPNEKLGRELAALSTHLARAAALVLPRSTHLGPRVLGAAPEAPPATLAGVGALGVSALRELAVRSLSEHEPLSHDECRAAWQDVELRRLVKIDEFEVAGRRFTIAIHPRSGMSRVAELTEREREAALLASEGLSNKLIADRMQISVSTVGTLLSRAGHKLGAESRVALMRARDQLERRS